MDRAWLEALLDHLPTPMVLVQPGTGDVLFANRAAEDLAGGTLPRGAPERRSSEGFRVTDPNGGQIARDDLPSVRAARGEAVDNVEVVWHTPSGPRPLLVRAGTLPGSAGEPGTIVLSFEDVSLLKAAEREKTESLALLDALFHAAPIGLGYWDRDLRFVRVNEKLAEINGVPLEEHPGRTIAELLPAMDPGVADEFRKVIDRGEAVLDLEFVGETPAASGEQRRFSTAAYPVRDPAGNVTGVGAVILDISERRRAQAERERAHALEREARSAAELAAARARFLADAGVLLDQSLDYEATLAAVSRLVVPWLADWCAIDMVEGDGTLRRVTTAHVDPGKIELAKEWERRYPTDPDSATGVPNVVRTGKPELYPDITDEMLVAAARDEEHLEMIRSLGMRGAMIVPMVARGRTLGAITFIAAETGRRYDEDDLLLAEELARRAATSTDNARLYSERSHIAQTLQNSLLPPHLPDIPGMELAGRYLPVGEGIDVGGDFYDIFEMGSGSWALVIGDVCGKGADAAALTALVRYTVRAIATADKLPSEILRQLNDAILRQRSDNRFCTVAYARVSKADAGVRVELASGGHPLPIVIRADGVAEFAGEPGTLLGVVPDPALHDAAVQLGPGDSIALYTDGVTEAGAPDRLLEPEDLAEAVSGCGGASASEIARCLEAKAVEMSGGDPHDDIAIVALHLPRLQQPLTVAPPVSASPTY
jgi:PAS domain S-box-containing protein